MPHRSNNVTRLTDENGLFAGLIVPEKDAFKGVLTEEQIANLNKEHLPMLLGISKIEQWSDWQNNAIQMLTEQVAVLSRQRKAERRLGMATLRWIATTVGAGLVAWLFARLK